MRIGTPALLCLLFFSANPVIAQPHPVRGRALFEDKGCRQCHAIGGAGGHKGPALDGVGKRLPKDELERQILKGGLVMPAFEDVLSHDEVQDIVEFLHKAKKSIVPARQP